MSVSVAQLNSNVALGLGNPDEALCSLVDIHYAVRNAVTLRTRQTRSSDNNQLLSTTAEFTPASSPHEITNLITGGTPAWIEYKEGSHWRPLKIAGSAFLEQNRLQGIRAAAFYGAEDGKNYVEFSFAVGTDTFRIRYDKDAVSVSLADHVLMPESLTILIELDAQNSLIPRIKRRLAEATEKEENRKLVQMQMDTWNDLYMHNASEIRVWEREFRIWKNRSRSAQSSSRLPNKSGKGLYGE